VKLTLSLVLCGDEFAEAIKISFVARGDDILDPGKDFGILECPIHGDLRSVAHVVKGYCAVVFWAAKVVDDK